MHEDLLARFEAGERTALARVISIVEDRRSGHEEVLRWLYPRAGTAQVVGVTGAPGAGKSTLTAAVAARMQASGRVAVLAIDPSSPTSGGAVLGDRVRMPASNVDADLYVRSMSTRGSQGGLAASTGVVVTALDAFGFDQILIETVGVGQSEVDIVRSADTVVLVTQPDSGDDIQLLKAGILEIADIFVINKADLPGADVAAMNLQALIGAVGADDGWELPLCETVATEASGVDALVDAIRAHAAHLDTTRTSDERRHQKTVSDVGWIMASILDRQHAQHLQELDRDSSLIEAIHRGECDPYTVAHDLIDGGRAR
jgi:LAO/AO transport system kinase